MLKVSRLVDDRLLEAVVGRGGPPRCREKSLLSIRKNSSLPHEESTSLVIGIPRAVPWVALILDVIHGILVSDRPGIPISRHAGRIPDELRPCRRKFRGTRDRIFRTRTPSIDLQHTVSSRDTKGRFTRIRNRSRFFTEKKVHGRLWGTVRWEKGVKF